MDLSIDLIKEFAKTTNDEPVIDKGSTAYGRYVLQGDKAFVEIDGSNGALTPVATTSTVKNNDRVTVLIKDHTAIVTGNLTDPSASSDDVENVKKTMGTATLDIEDLKEKLSNQEITLKEYETAIEDAKRVATDYIDFTAGTGLVIGSTTISNNVRIYSGGIDIRNGETILASYTDNTIKIGANNRHSSIELLNGLGTIEATSNPETSYDSLSILGDNIYISQPITSEDQVDSYIFMSKFGINLVGSGAHLGIGSTLSGESENISFSYSDPTTAGPTTGIEISKNFVDFVGKLRVDTLSDGAASGEASSYKLLVAGSTGIMYKSKVSLDDLVSGSMKVTAVFG